MEIKNHKISRLEGNLKVIIPIWLVISFIISLPMALPAQPHQLQWQGPPLLPAGWRDYLLLTRPQFLTHQIPYNSMLSYWQRLLCSVHHWLISWEFPQTFYLCLKSCHITLSCLSLGTIISRGNEDHKQKPSALFPSCSHPLFISFPTCTQVLWSVCVLQSQLLKDHSQIWQCWDVRPWRGDEGTKAIIAYMGWVSQKYILFNPISLLIFFSHFLDCSLWDGTAGKP